MNEKTKRPLRRLPGMPPSLGLLIASLDEVSTYNPAASKPEAIVQKDDTKPSIRFVKNLIRRSRLGRVSA